MLSLHLEPKSAAPPPAKPAAAPPPAEAPAAAPPATPEAAAAEVVVEPAPAVAMAVLSPQRKPGTLSRMATSLRESTAPVTARREDSISGNHEVADCGRRILGEEAQM